MRHTKRNQNGSHSGPWRSEPWELLSHCKQPESWCVCVYIYIIASRHWITGCARCCDLWEEGNKSSEPHDHPVFCLEAASRSQPREEEYKQSPQFPWFGKTEMESLGSWNLGGAVTREKGAGKVYRGIPSSLCQNIDIYMCVVKLHKAKPLL